MNIESKEKIIENNLVIPSHPFVKWQYLLSDKVVKLNFTIITDIRAEFIKLFINNYILDNSRIKIINHTLDNNFSPEYDKNLSLSKIKFVFNKMTKKFMNDSKEYYGIRFLLELFGYFDNTGGYSETNTLTFTGGHK